MPAKMISAYGFECPDCREAHVAEEPLELQAAWAVEEVLEGAKGLCVTVDEPEETEVYIFQNRRIGQDCVFDEEPKYQPAYRCTECYAITLDQEEAATCCKITVLDS